MTAAGGNPRVGASTLFPVVWMCHRKPHKIRTAASDSGADGRDAGLLFGGLYL